MPISSRAVRNQGKFNSSIESENFLSWSRMDSFGEPTHAAFDFMVRPLRPAETSQAHTLDEPGTNERAPDPGGFIQVPTNLIAGRGVAIVAYATDAVGGTDDDDIIRFVLLAPIGTGTQIFFTDRLWNGTAFAAAGGGEGTFTYTAGADLAAGTVITITSAQLVTAGMNLADVAGETIYVYQGTDANTPTAFLYAIDIADENTTFNGSLVNTGLTVGTNAVAVGHDQASYAGPSTQIAQTQTAAISNNAQWHGHSGNDIGGTIYDDRADTSLSGPLTNPDMQLFVVNNGGGQSDAIVRIDNDEAANIGTNLTRLFRDNPMFTRLEDITFDIEDGVWFAADNEGTDITRILKGNIADLFNGNPNPTITVVFDYVNNGADPNDDKFIQGIEIDTVANRIFFGLGDISFGHELRSVDYNGGNSRNWGLIDLVIDPTFGFAGGIEDLVVDTANNTAYFSYVLVNAGAGQVLQNYVVRLTAPLNAAAPNPAVENYAIVNITNAGPPPAGYAAGRLPDAEGSIRGMDYHAATNTLWFVTGRLGAGGTGGIFTLNLTTGVYTEIWQQPSNNAHNTPQSFPTTLLVDIEVDSIGGRYYVTSLNSTDTPIGHDGTATDENGSRIWSGSLTSPIGTAPTFFASVFENTANGAGAGMEIDYAPTLTVGSAGSTYTESTNLPASPAGPTVDVATSPAVNDVDQAIIQGATVAITTGFVTGDQLTFTNSGGITGTYNATTGVITFTGNASFAAYQTVLDSVRFTNAGDNPTNYGANTSRTISFTVFDGLINSDPATATLTVVGINDAPVITPGAASSGILEDSTGTAGAPAPPPVPRNAITGISVFDVDANPATQDIVVTLSVALGTLSIRTDVVGGLTAGEVTGNGTGTLVLTGTQNQINATLAAVNNVAGANGLVYTPPADFNGATTLTITTNDQGFNGNDPGISGTGTSESDSDTKIINITNVNDAPTVIDATQSAATILEDTPSPGGETIASLFTGSFSDALDQQQVPVTNPTGSVANTLAGIAIVGIDVSGTTGRWQYFNGSWLDIPGASTASAFHLPAGTAIRFNPALNFNGTAPALTVHLVDSSGGAIAPGGEVFNLTGATGGITRYSSGTVTLSQAVTPVNDAPVIANFTGDFQNHFEGDAPRLLDIVPNAALVTDVDSSNFDGGSLTVAITAGGDPAEDELGVSAGGLITTDPVAVGNTVSYNGTVIGTYTSDGKNGAPLTILFDADATPAAVAALISRLTYFNTDNNNPTAGGRTIELTLDDGDGTANGGDPTGTATTIVTVVPVNDPPSGADKTILMNEDGTQILAAADFGFTDPAEGHAFAGVVITTLPANGDLYLNNVLITVAGTFVTIADINSNLLTFRPDPNANGVGYTSFTFQVRDNGGGSNTDPNPDTITFDVTAVNDAPANVVPLAAQNINEDGSVTFSNGGANAISVSDVDVGAGNLTVTLSIADGVLTLSGTAGLVVSGNMSNLVTLTGTATDINTALNGLTYAPPAQASGSRTLTVTTNDNGNTGTPGALQDIDTVTINIAAVNDTPVVAVAPTASSTEQVAGTIDATATITDIELGALNNYAGSTLTVARMGGAVAQDVLGFGASGAFTVNGGNLEAPGGLVFATFAGGNGTALVITFTGSGTPATQALVNAVVQSLQYTNTSDTPPASIQMVYTFDDGAPGNAGQGGGGSPTGTDTITINITDTPENQAPTLDLDADDSSGAIGTGYTAAFTEGGAAVLITDADVAIADVDAGDVIEGATIAINSAVAGDQLVLGAQGGFVITGSGTATITIAGTGTAAQYEAMLEQITFSTSSEDPGASRTITTTVTDGTANSNAAVTTINITQINDEPTLTATGVSPTFTEGGAGADLFSTVSASTIEAGQSFTSLTLTVSNVTDGADEILGIDGTSIALTNGNSVVSTHGTVNVTVALGTATVTFTSAGVTPAELQTLIDNLTYGNAGQNPTDVDRVVTITQVTDSGSNVSPDDNTTTLGIISTVNVNPVNDAPVNAVPTAQTIDEDASVTFSSGGGNPITVSDADLAPGNVTVTLSIADGSLVPVSGGGAVIGNSGTNNVTITGTLAQVNAALEGLVYTPPAHANGSRTLTVTTSDNGNSGGPAQQDIDTVTINITAQNDTPVVAIATTVAAVEQTAVTLDAAATVSDIDLDARNGGNGDYGGALMTIQRQSGADAQDLFAITGGAGFTVSGNQLLSGGLEFATIETVSPGLFRVNFTSAQTAATTALANAVARAIQYTNSSNTPPASVDLILALLDGSPGGGQGGGPNGFVGADTITVTIGAVNDAPVTTAPASASGNEDSVVMISGINVSDVDAGGGTLTVTLDIASGSLFPLPASGATVTGAGTNHVVMSGTLGQINGAISTLMYQPAANANGSFTLTITTEDNGNTGSGGNQVDIDTVTITINSVNDAPSGANNTLTGSEDDPLVFTAADFGFSDPADGNTLLAVRITTLPGVGQLRLNGVAVNAGDFIPVAQINSGQFTFHPVADQFGNNYASFTFQVQDNGGVLMGGVDLDQSPNTMTINIAPDNQPPVVDLDGAAGGVNHTTTFVEDGAAVAIGSGVIVSDPDSGLGDMIESATITLTDRVAGDSLTITGALPAGITAVTTPSAGAITIQITGPGTGAQYQALIQSIQYATTSQDPTVGGTDLARTITVTVNDGTISSAVATTTVNVTAVDDAAVAQGDAFTITESGTIVGGNLFADNGSGVDGDPDGPPLAISAVNGSAGNVNTQIALASGALLTVNSNGTFNYDPNGAFLRTPTAGSGASNTPAHDGFTYTLAGGNTVAVSITLTGLDTDDTLRGTAGADILMGGNGNDWYFVENATDQVVEGVGQGSDRVFASVSYTLTAGAEVELLTTDFHTGTAAIDLTGNALAQAIHGNDGDNKLDGGAGADTLVGRAGNDWFFVDNAGDGIVENAGEGSDRVFASVSYTLATGAAVELMTTDFHTGTAAINLTGNNLANTIFGNDGDNILNGGTGADALVGRAGNDWFFVDNAGDYIFEAAGEGSDRVFASVSYTLAAGAEVELMSTDFHAGTAAINLTGNELANTIFGNAGANILTGGGGADSMYGFAGNDTYYVASPGEQVFESSGNGNDAVYSSASYTLGAGQEIEFLSADNYSATTALNLTGNDLANTIYGNAGANILDGKDGNDSLVGLGGADTFAFTTALGAGNVDLVFGFELGIDKIALDDAIFGAGIGGVGAFNANAFHVGAAAHDLDDRIIYNSATGQLLFDADGSGAGVAIQFATLSPGLSLTATDFQVI
ncbi:MAG TPA: Ig-like domain-containing protein [Allosphingosinicella sp.]|nr:Ig-like domain-containing protein [Allosphingosinicella sp.]